MNILLYGPPGTGKTEFCKVLAERLGVTLYRVGEADDDGDEPSRGERLQELRLAQRLLARDGRSLLLFDEMEDLLSEGHAGLSLFGQPFFGGSRNGGSKVYMHRLLERAPAPTLWAMNDARSVSQTLLRRMMFALELRPPSAAVRARIWSRQLEHHGIEAGTRRGTCARAGVRRDARRGRRCHRGRANRRRRDRDGAARRSRSLPGALLRRAAPGNPAALRPRPDPGRYRPGRPGGQPRGQRRAAFLPLPAGTAGDGQKSAFVRYLAEQIRAGGDAEAGLRPDVHVDRRERSRTSQPPSPRRVTPAHSSSSTRRIRCSPTGAVPRARGKSARSTRC